MRRLTIAALLLPMAAYAQSPPSNAPSGSGTPVGPPPAPAVAPPTNQTGGALPPGLVAPPLRASAPTESNTSVPEK